MIHYIERAAENFSIHQLESKCEKQSNSSKMRTFIAYIDVNDTGGSVYRVYLGCEKPLMQEIAAIFLAEDESNDETLTDLTLEVANMVIGSAKVLAEEEDIAPFSITTPIFEKYDEFDISSDSNATLQINGHLMCIAIKEL
jgi:CheY-specific phosphatase CheX